MSLLDDALTDEQQRLLKLAIDDVMANGTGFARVTLVYERYRLRFIESQLSYSALPHQEEVIGDD